MKAFTFGAMCGVIICICIAIMTWVFPREAHAATLTQDIGPIYQGTTFHSTVTGSGEIDYQFQVLPNSGIAGAGITATSNGFVFDPTSRLVDVVSGVTWPVTVASGASSSWFRFYEPTLKAGFYRLEVLFTGKGEHSIDGNFTSVVPLPGAFWLFAVAAFGLLRRGVK